jgi:hypothetical protein
VSISVCSPVPETTTVALGVAIVAPVAGATIRSATKTAEDHANSRLENPRGAIAHRPSVASLAPRTPVPLGRLPAEMWQPLLSTGHSDRSHIPLFIRGSQGECQERGLGPSRDIVCVCADSSPVPLPPGQTRRRDEAALGRFERRWRVQRRKVWVGADVRAEWIPTQSMTSRQLMPLPEVLDKWSSPATRSMRRRSAFRG